jgi:hypothetical protein
MSSAALVHPGRQGRNGEGVKNEYGRLFIFSKRIKEEPDKRN